jgi:hypothetical protein
MKYQNIKESFFLIVKVISTFLMTSAIGLEIFNIFELLTKQEIPATLNLLIHLAYIPIIAHFIEALIAAYYAPSKNQNPLKYSVYTFFTGTVGLLELLAIKDKEIS